MTRIERRSRREAIRPVLMPTTFVLPPTQPGPGQLWCGHPESAAKVDSNGVSYCSECS